MAKKYAIQPPGPPKLFNHDWIKGWLLLNQRAQCAH